VNKNWYFATSFVVIVISAAFLIWDIPQRSILKEEIKSNSIQIESEEKVVGDLEESKLEKEQEIKEIEEEIIF